MTAIQLRDKLNEFIELGRGDEPVLFDSDAMCFDQLMIDIKDVSWEDPKELGDDFNGIWLHWDWEKTKFTHFRKDERESEKQLNVKLLDKYSEELKTMTIEEFKNKYFKTSKEFEEFNDKIKKDLAVTEEQMKTHYGEEKLEMTEDYKKIKKAYQNNGKVIL